MDDTPTTPTTASPETASHTSTAPVAPIVPTGLAAPPDVLQFEDLVPLLTELPISPPTGELPSIDIDLPGLESAELKERAEHYGEVFRTPPGSPLIPQPPSRESSPGDTPIELTTTTPTHSLPETHSPPEEHSSVRMWRHLADQFWHPPDTSRRSPSPPGTPHKKMRMSPHHHIPSQAVTRPVSPSQPDSPSQRQRTTLTTYATPLRRSTSLPLTTIEPPDEPFNIDAPPEHETQSIDSVDFIRSIYTWDDPTIAQPEDAALLLYLAGTAPY